MTERADLLERRRALSSAKRALLERRLLGGAGGASPDIRPAPRSGQLEPSFVQERLWFLHELDSHSATYNEFAAYRVQGPFERELLDRALGLVVQRHSVLRTRFALESGRLTASVQAVGAFRSEAFDLRELGATERRDALLRLARSEARRPFDLARPPLLRCVIASMGPCDSAVMLTMHHIASDGWSTGVLLREFGRAYAALASGKEPDLPPLPIQYSDFAHWQREKARSPEYQMQLAWWKERLYGTAPLLELPTDRPRPHRLDTAGRRREFRVPRRLAEALRQLSRDSGATLFMTLLAAFNVLLARYAGRTDIVVGTPVSGRTHVELEPLVGCFINTLVLRVNLEGDPTFVELLSRVRRVALDSFANQDVAFEHLVEHMKPERTLGSAPIFQVMFALQNFPTATEDPPGLRIEPIPIETETSKLDLSVFMEETADGLLGLAEYRTNLFDSDTVARMVGHFTQLLEAVVANPRCSIWQLPLLSARERHELTLQCDVSRRVWPDDRPIPRLFEAQVARTPDAIALRCGDDRLTYAELNRRANALAHRLRAAGIGSKSLVPVCLRRSPDLLVALLGVSKAAAAYVPLDPRVPGVRLAKMFDDVAPQIVLTDEASASVLPPGTHFWAAPAWGSHDAISDPGWPIDADGPAYVIYTSGSTGTPKGVEVPHGALTNVVLAVGTEVGHAAAGVMFAVTTVSFDIAALELFMPLVHGGTVELAEDALCQDGAALARRMEACRPSVMQATPTAWRMLLAAGWRGRPDLDVLCGGEALSTDLAAELASRAARVRNLYGPTETTVWSTIHRVEQGSAFVPIGRPLANTQAYILDSRLQPIPDGMIGELYIAGRGVARGYVRRPELTAERFLPDPFGPAGARMYRTGDLVRRSAAGLLEFHGRADDQMKVRGFRIEPGDIEAAFREHPAVVDVVVVADAAARVLAHVVLAPDVRTTERELRTFVGERLPSYMVPSLVRLIDELPRTANGKVDRNALRATTVHHDEVEQPSNRNHVEELLSSIFGDVLAIPRVPMTASFFELGGHSLLAADVIARIGDVFDVALPIHRMFDAPSVATLAEVVMAALRERNGTVDNAIVPAVAAAGPRNVTLAQQHMWRLHRANPRSPHNNLSRAMLLEGPVDLEAIRASFTALVTRHPILGATFAQDADVVTQTMAPSPTFDMAVLDLGDVPEQEREEKVRGLIWAFSRLPFDLAKGALLRVLVLCLAPDRHVVVVSTHHIVCDGWSLAVLSRDLRVLYDAALASVPARLPELTVQYADYADWQRSDETRRVMDRSLAYWIDKLAGAASDPGLAAVGDRTQRSLRYRVASTRLDEETTAGLRLASQRAGVSMFMSLMTALAAAVRVCGGRDDFAFGTLTANRTHRETRELIGLFVNTIVLRFAVERDVTLTTLAHRVRAAALEAYARQDVPFEAVVEALRARGSISAPFQILVIYQNVGPDTERPTKVVARDVEIVPPDASDDPVVIPSTFDLIVEIEESGGGHRVSAKYAVDALEGALVDDLLHAFRIAAGALIEDPGRTISDLDRRAR